MDSFTTVQQCRSCDAPLPAPFLDLGVTPIANRLLPDADAPAPAFPLGVSHCSQCSLVQLSWALPAEAIFDDDYPYYSSFSDALVAHAKEHADRLIAERGLDASSLVVEIASNDGYLLQHFKARGIPVLGIEPTAGPAAAARALGIDTLQEFFTDELASSLVAQGRQADVIIANNVMAHVPDLNGFVSGMSRLLKPGGTLTVENPSLVELLRHAEFDTIYHEHYCYFSCVAVSELMGRHGLQLRRVDDLPDLHGGSLRWWVSHEEAAGSVEESAYAHLEAERDFGVAKPETYADFAGRIARIQRELVELLQALRSDGSRVAAYGAAAKGATLLNSSGIDVDVIDFVVDRNPHKQGKWMPGARLPILPVEALQERQPDYLLLLAWNFAAEIRKQQAEYLQRGGKLIIPVPEPRIVSD